MKSNLKIDTKNFIAEVSISNVIEDSESDMHSVYMDECMKNDATFINTAGMSTSDAKYMCGMSYMKNRQMLTEGAGELTEKQMNLPDSVKKSILKRYEKAGTITEKGKEQLISVASNIEIEIKEDNNNEENENESEETTENETNEQDTEEDKMEEIQAEPTAVFIQESAPPSGDITPKAAEEGLKIDEKLQKEQEAVAPKDPQLQSPTFNPKL